MLFSAGTMKTSPQASNTRSCLRVRCLGKTEAAADSNVGLLRGCAAFANAQEPQHARRRNRATGHCRAATIKEHALAGCIHRHVRNGNDGRAARCLDSSRMAVIDDATIAKLKALHPPASPPITPTVEVGPAGPVEMDADRSLGILQRLAQGTAAGLIGWTYEHICAAGLHSQRTRDTIRCCNLGSSKRSDPQS